MLLIAALFAPAGASASGIGDAYRDYAQDGSLDACKYSAAELQALLSSVPTDIAQYDPRFVDELNRALNARASGACAKKKKGSGNTLGTIESTGSGGSSGGGGPATAADGSPKPAATPQVTTGVSAAATPELGSDRGFPTALAVLAGLMGLALLGTGGWALGRHYGWSPTSFFQGMREGFGR